FRAFAVGGSAEHPAATLLRLARQVRPLPGWTLTTMWLLEVGLGWPDPPGPRLEALLQAELGDLYCQTGDIVQGLKLLDSAAEASRERERPEEASREREPPEAGLEHALRAARWVELLHPEVAANRLEKLCEP